MAEILKLVRPRSRAREEWSIFRVRCTTCGREYQTTATKRVLLTQQYCNVCRPGSTHWRNAQT